MRKKRENRDTERLPLSELVKLLEYRPTTGEFAWLQRLSARIQVGDIAGSLDSKGYNQIMIRGKNYKDHVLAWLFTFGEYPTEDIDHINGKKNDNRVENLRGSSRTQNLYNTGLREDNTTGHKGVYLRKDTGKYSAYMNIEGKRCSLGCYATLDESAGDYRRAAMLYQKEFCHASILK